MALRQTKLSQFAHFSLVLRERQETKTKYSASRSEQLFLKVWMFLTVKKEICTIIIYTNFDERMIKYPTILTG